MDSEICGQTRELRTRVENELATYKQCEEEEEDDEDGEEEGNYAHTFPSFLVRI